MAESITISYFTDVLCVWAYIAQIRLEELKRQFGDQVHISYHFFPLFGCTDVRIGEGWKAKGGYDGFNGHVREVCTGFPHVELHDQVWRTAVPKTSGSAHHFLKAVQLLEEAGVIPSEPVEQFEGRTLFEENMWQVRRAFFCESRDIADMDVLLATGESLGLPLDRVNEELRTGRAMAAMCRDMEIAKEYRVTGSPTYVLNAGRQTLYGNVGYKIIEANVHEVLNRPDTQTTWC